MKMIQSIVIVLREQRVAFEWDDVVGLLSLPLGTQIECGKDTMLAKIFKHTRFQINSFFVAVYRHDTGQWIEYQIRLRRRS
jgi:hypothetical protein